MEPQTLTYAELSKYEQDIVSQGRGWDGTHYTDPKSGAVIELVEVEGETKYRVLAKGDVTVTGDVATEVAAEPETPAAPVQETEPTAPATEETTVPTDETPAATDVPETTTDSAPTGEATDGTEPAATEETTPQGEQTPA